MAYREDQLNGRIASAINRIAGASGWKAREELKGALRPRTENRGGGAGVSKQQPDVLILRAGEPPIILENEYTPAHNLECESLERLGRELNPKVVKSEGFVSSVVAIQSPDDLKSCANGDEADRMLAQGIELEYAVYHGSSPSAFSRFPSRGFVSGDIKELVAFIRPASLPNDIIEDAADELEAGASDVAAQLVRRVEEQEKLNRKKGEPLKKTQFARDIEGILRQPWPTPDPDPKTPRAKKAAALAAAQRAQTAMMCATIVINALAYQQNLAGIEEGINDIYALKSQARGARITKSELLAEWERILDLDYWPIFHIAKELLTLIESTWVDPIMGQLTSTAERIQGAIRQSDVAGIVFQRLIADRQTLATYYTTPASTVLAAYLAIPDSLNWEDREFASTYKIADYACGSGGLLLAAYQRVRELHRSSGADPDGIHKAMMENGLTACDIMPAAVHLSSSLLSSAAPNQKYETTRSVLYPFGGQKKNDRDGKPILDEQGTPVLHRAANGDPIVDIGSLALLDLRKFKHQVVFPLDATMALGSKGKESPFTIEMRPRSQDLVIMNPPFTTPTNHAAEHQDTVNPAFASFGTTEEEQKAMEKKVKRLSKGTVGDGRAGLASQFAAIADNMVAEGGRIALILPINAMIGGSSDAKVLRSWQKFRNLLASEYNDVIVTSIAGATSKLSAFSADTELAECLVVARKRRAGEAGDGKAVFVNLRRQLSSKLDAQETAKAILREIDGSEGDGSISIVRVGDDELGWLRTADVDPSERWTNVRIIDGQLVECIESLAGGKLRLPRSLNPFEVPIARFGKISEIGLSHRSTNDAFNVSHGNAARAAYPMLWLHEQRDKRTKKIVPTQRKMRVAPDTSGTPLPGKKEQANKIWQTASNLHINNEFRFNANPLAACFTENVSLGGSTWSTAKMASPDLEKVTCVFQNSTLGMMLFWLESARPQDGRGRTTVTAIPNIPTLDVTAISSEATNAGAKIFDSMKNTDLLPANEAYRDSVRQELDRRVLTEILGLSDDAFDQLAVLRDQWCAEPTVMGTKSTGITFHQELHGYPDEISEPQLS